MDIQCEVGTMDNKIKEKYRIEDLRVFFLAVSVFDNEPLLRMLNQELKKLEKGKNPQKVLKRLFRLKKQFNKQVFGRVSGKLYNPYKDTYKSR